MYQRAGLRIRIRPSRKKTPDQDPKKSSILNLGVHVVTLYMVADTGGVDRNPDPTFKIKQHQDERPKNTRRLTNEKKKNAETGKRKKISQVQ